MNELAQAWAELERLEKREQELHRKLSNIKGIINIQKSLIEELVQRTPPPINHLPIETLSWILNLALQGDSFTSNIHPHRKMELGKVSHCWKDVIFNCPSFWTTIDVTPNLGPLIVKEHVERSGKCLLDISIQSWEGWQCHSDLQLQLSLVVPSADCWSPLRTIFDTLGNLKFPSLIHAAIIGYCCIIYPQFLRPENSPALKHMELKNLYHQNNNDIPFSSNLLNLTLKSCSDALPLNLCSLQQLTTLSLMTNASYMSLEPNSVHFPFLTSLMVKVSKFNLTKLMAVIMASKVAYFCYWELESSPCQQVTLSSGFQSKFKNAQYIALYVKDLGSIDTDIYSAFPNVYGAEIHVQPFNHISPGTNNDCLSISASTTTLMEILGGLSSRLHLQQPRQAMLHIKLRNKLLFSVLFDSLHEYCVLELVNVPLSNSLPIELASVHCFLSPNSTHHKVICLW
ncbi:hypothetical protein V8B97DRAFT_2102903 [Scleroderma yunnanense]